MELSRYSDRHSFVASSHARDVSLTMSKPSAAGRLGSGLETRLHKITQFVRPSSHPALPLGAPEATPRLTRIIRNSTLCVAPRN
jgi:hypothetical protein